MTEHSRVLVVDDVAEMRMLIDRALGDSGYAVDVAATLTQARGLGPGGYDAVLVDAHLGSERGLDLIDELRSEDPAAVQRCIVMSGGPAQALPDGVRCLYKPFRPDDLIEAVRSLSKPAAHSLPGRPAVIAAQPGPLPPSAGQPRAQNQAAADARLWPMLSFIRSVREREHRELIDFLHDGPIQELGTIQELAAAAIDLQLLARSMGPRESRAVDSVLQRIGAAGDSLRWLLDGQWPSSSAPAREALRDVAPRQRERET